MQDIIERFVSPSGKPVRVVVRDGEPWFVAKDVCDNLGTRTNNVRKIVGDKRVTTIYDYSIVGNGRGHGGEMLLVSEAGLYKLILVSRKKGAVAFQDWLTDEVLPSIRKHGAYMTPEVERNIVEHPEEAVALAKALREKTKRLKHAEADRDKAVRERSWISSSREAKALSELSIQHGIIRRLKGEVRRLEGELKDKRKENDGLETENNDLKMKIADLEMKLDEAMRKIEELLPDAEAYRRWLEAWKNGMNRWHEGMVDPGQTRLWNDDHELLEEVQ